MEGDPLNAEGTTAAEASGAPPQEAAKEKLQHRTTSREQVPLHRLLPPLPGGQKLLLDTTILRKTTPPVLLQALRERRY